MEGLLHIGTHVEAVQSAKEAILEILSVHADQKTIRLALKVFMKSVQPSNIVVSDCTFNGGLDPTQRTEA